MVTSTLIHIPHSSLVIPEDIKNEFKISQNEILSELLILADRYTDDIFQYEGSVIHQNKVSRLVFDPERFRNDEDEGMSKFGMGAIYQKTVDGKILRKLSSSRREELLRRFYDPYHKQLTGKVAACLESGDKCLIIDGHSFPSSPLAFEKDKERSRPDICVGSDTFHTPKRLVEIVRDFVLSKGYSFDNNHPFAGSLVPMIYYGKDRRVSSIMIEINRKLYMDETTGEKNSDYKKTKIFIHNLLKTIIGNS